MNSSYRPDIDGLRAFAVMSVMLFHLDFSFASGGFIGVDVFFVISGFLITRLIKKEIEASGRFNYTNFYIRRIRRIFPALFVTICITLVFSVLLFSPLHLERVGGSVIHALSSLSNIYFWAEAGYFDPAAGVKPLLHTWSLGIEEQFYLIWPLLLVLIVKTQNKRLSLLLLGAMVSLSLSLNSMFQYGYVDEPGVFPSYIAKLLSDGQSTIFYLLPFRMYEFAIGGMIAFSSNRVCHDRLVYEVFMLAGIGMLAYSFFMFSEHTPFPSHNALLPCIGAALVIYSGDSSRFLGRLFSNRLAVGIGLISYSLYLVHWPTIVFWKYYTFEALSPIQTTAILIISLLFATLMYKYVEQPCRLKKHAVANNSLVATRGVVALFIGSLIVVLSSNIWRNEGWSWRMSSTVSPELIPPEARVINLEQLSGGSPWIYTRTIGNENKAATKLLVLGDSHAGHLTGAAKYISEKYNTFFTFYTFTGCPPVFGAYKVYGAPSAIRFESLKQIACRKQTEAWEKYVRAGKFDYVVLGSRWNSLFEPEAYLDSRLRRDLLVEKSNPKFTINDSKRVFSSKLDYTIKVIHSTGAKAIVFGQVPHAGKELEGCDNVPHLLISENTVNNRCNHVPRELVLKRSEFSNRTIKQVASINNAAYVIPTDIFCKEEGEYCRLFYKNTRLKDDDDHINEYGSVFLARQWELSNEFPFK